MYSFSGLTEDPLNRPTGLVVVLDSDTVFRERAIEATRVVGAAYASCERTEDCLQHVQSVEVACVFAENRLAFDRQPSLIGQLEAAGYEPPVITRFAAAEEACSVQQDAWKAVSPDAKLDELSLLTSEALEEARRRADDRHTVQSFHEDISRLSDDELEVLDAVCEGKLNKQIARDLGVSVRTVEQRRRRVFAKMHVASAVPLASRVATVKTIERFRPRLRRRLRARLAAASC